LFEKKKVAQKEKEAKQLTKLQKQKQMQEKKLLSQMKRENKENIVNKRKKMPTIISNVKCPKNIKLVRVDDK